MNKPPSRPGRAGAHTPRASTEADRGQRAPQQGAANEGQENGSDGWVEMTMHMHELWIATLNLENGERIDLLPELVAKVPGLDLLMLQEGRGWDCLGQKRRFQAENLLAAVGLDRSFLTRSTRGTPHELVLIRSASMRPLGHYTPDLPDVFHDQIGAVELLADGLTPPVTARSIQWPHWSGDARLNEALRLTRYAAPGACAVIAGDFNSLYPDCDTHAAEFEPDWTQLPPYKRHHGGYAVTFLASQPPTGAAA